MKKKLLAIALAAIMVLVAITGASLAYLQDTDYDKNVMTVGNVKIEQIEADRYGTPIVYDGTQKLLPAVYVGTLAYDGSATVNGKTQAIWDATVNNELDKIVTVNNTGSEAAYVRTIFAFEDKVVDGKYISEQIHTLWNSSASVYADGVKWVESTTTPGEYPTITVDGVNYTICVFTYKDPIAAGNSSDASLVQLFLDPKSDNSFFEAIKNSYDILVLSQAVQSVGFTGAEQALNAAFGEINDANIGTIQDWFKDHSTP